MITQNQMLFAASANALIKSHSCLEPGKTHHVAHRITKQLAAADDEMRNMRVKDDLRENVIEYCQKALLGGMSEKLVLGTLDHQLTQIRDAHKRRGGK